MVGPNRWQLAVLVVLVVLLVELASVARTQVAEALQQPPALIPQALVLHLHSASSCALVSEYPSDYLPVRLLLPSVLRL